MDQAGVPDRSLRVLIVDDDEDLLASEGRILIRAGFEVVSALDGETAVEILQSAPPFDVVLCDLRLSGMSGIDVLTECRRLWPDTRVLIITAYGDENTRSRVWSLGGTDLLIKPVLKRDLIAAIERSVSPVSG